MAKRKILQINVVKQSISVEFVQRLAHCFSDGHANLNPLSMTETKFWKNFGKISDKQLNLFGQWMENEYLDFLSTSNWADFDPHITQTIFKDIQNIFPNTSYSQWS